MKRLTTKIDDTYTCSYCENQEAVDKLGMLEDFMEENGFESFNELKQYYVNLIELKDWIEDRIDGTESDNGIYTEFHSGQCNAYCKVLDKLYEMQELEKDDE